MAGFTCQICGGSIKMQANQTGVCQGCGMEYDIEAIREMAGQLAVSVSGQQVQNEMDRKTLIAHLDDVRVLETLISKTKQTILKLENKITETKDLLEQDRLKLQQETDNCDKARALADTKSAKQHLTVAVIAFAAAAVFMVIYGRVAELVGNMKAFWFFIPVGPAELLLIGLVKFGKYCFALKKMKSQEKMIDGLKCRVEQMKDNLEQNANRAVALMDDTSEKKKDNLKELAEFEELLTRAYSANIIPAQFRNIEGVYYLYDYLSTSNQSLSEALMQANLEAIKQKLDNMIEIQSAQIIEQRITNAKLGKALKYSEAIMDYSEATMKNTALAARYAQITAINSEINKRLATQQLSYQKAEFLLK